MAQQVYFRTNAHIVEWASTLARNGHQFVIADAFPHPNITFRASQEYVDGFLNNDDFPELKGTRFDIVPDKQMEIETLMKLHSMEGYFHDALSDSDMETMRNNIRNDFPLFNGTSMVDGKTFNQTRQQKDDAVMASQQLANHVDALIDACITSGIDDAPTSIVGMAQVIKRKVALGIELSDEQREYIIKNL